MRSKFAALAVLIPLAGCAFAQQHPGVTVGIAAGSIGFLSCEIDADRPGTCAVVGGVVGVGLGLITGLVTLIADTGDHSLPSDDEDQEQLTPEGALKVHTHTEPPPVPPDAGPAPGDAGAAPADVISPDA